MRGLAIPFLPRHLGARWAPYAISRRPALLGLSHPPITARFASGEYKPKEGKELRAHHAGEATRIARRRVVERATSCYSGDELPMELIGRRAPHAHPTETWERASRETSSDWSAPEPLAAGCATSNGRASSASRPATHGARCFAKNRDSVPSEVRSRWARAGFPTRRSRSSTAK